MQYNNSTQQQQLEMMYRQKMEQERKLHEIKRIGLETKKALEQGDVVKLGEYLDEHWNIKKQLSKSISNPYIDESGAAPPKNAEITIKNMKYYFHPKDGSYNYRIDCHGKSIVFATDVEQYVESDQRLVKFAEGADILLHDSQYSLNQYKQFQGYGHSNYKMACDVANKAKVKKLFIGPDKLRELMANDSNNILQVNVLPSSFVQKINSANLCYINNIYY